jgi:hypothetical protein
MILIAGDSIIDWIIKNKKVTPTVGGAGNIVRGLDIRGHDVRFLTLYNPMLYPISYTMDLHENSLTDFNHRNVFVRDYDKKVFHRFRQNLQTNVIDVKQATAVICHEDSIIRRFESFYADVRDTSVKGTCEILRMSSSDDTEKIMATIDHKLAIITYKDKVEAKGLFVPEPDMWTTIPFQEVSALDDIGAGDSFNVGFLDCVLRGMSFEKTLIEAAIKRGIEVAQEKVTNIGVFMNG